MTCSELMTKDVAICYPDERADVAARLMRDRNVGALVVIGRDRHPVGFITDRDFAVSVCANAEDSYYKKVKELMHSPTICCKDSDDLGQVCSIMTEHRIRRVPIVNGQGELVGIISVDDLARSLDSEEVKSLLTSLSVVAMVNARGT
jgi:CBS domain-containing protein